MVDPEVLLEKDHTIGQMKETIEILELKIKKLEQLVKLKDSKIANLSGKLQSMGIMNWVKLWLKWENLKAVSQGSLNITCIENGAVKSDSDTIQIYYKWSEQ